MMVAHWSMHDNEESNTNTINSICMALCREALGVIFLYGVNEHELGYQRGSISLFYKVDSQYISII